jgi:hypothetical protein
VDFNMTEMNEETAAQFTEYTVLAKFEGDASPENLIEQVHIQDGEVIMVEKFENGELISSETVKEVE